ncbi:unnamed protein product [Hermetia illucens]|uniref:DNA-directed RNA polymerase III subunit RPC4 n=1 Tax=Hermetia illucens TaxID=343691 RepID=A0A7R8ULC8_HERIL|nr:DNA-directed RNA polymerase III subunit RPC4 [Hermetia illucens]CAD7082774.1 unnamed protein product [Hermetia illucens]
MATGSGGSAFTSVRVKQEPMETNGIDGVIQRPGRLTTFKVPRDLTLGGAGPLRTQRGNANKKVYTPNLNVTRNKNLNVKTSKDSTSRGRGRGERGKLSDRGGRGRGGRGGLVQTAGLFSEGAGALQMKRQSSGSYRSASSDRDDTAGLRRPTLIKREGKVDTSAENQHLRDIVGDSDDEDFKDEKTDQEFVPVKLNEAKWTVPKLEPDITIKKEIKTEEGESEAITDKFSFMKVKSEFIAPDRYPASLEEFFSRSRAQLFLMQLPDSMPCQEAVASDEPSTSKEKSDSTEEMTKTNPLNSLEEGQIGKIVRYRSGKFKLILGETSFDLSLGTESGFLQEAMSISTNREERSGNMINLGTIQAKIQATPDWDFLFKNCS